MRIVGEQIAPGLFADTLAGDSERFALWQSVGIRDHFLAIWALVQPMPCPEWPNIVENSGRAEKHRHFTSKENTQATILL